MLWHRGNEGFGGHHYEGRVRNNENLNISFIVSPKLELLYITLWKDFVDDFAIELIAPNGETTGVILPNERNRSVVIGSTGVYFFNTEPVPYNGEQELLFVLKAPFAGREVSSGNWEIRIRGLNIVDRGI